MTLRVKELAMARRRRKTDALVSCEKLDYYSRIAFPGLVFDNLFLNNFPKFQRSTAYSMPSIGHITCLLLNEGMKPT